MLLSRPTVLAIWESPLVPLHMPMTSYPTKLTNMPTTFSDCASGSAISKPRVASYASAPHLHLHTSLPPTSNTTTMDNNNRGHLISPPELKPPRWSLPNTSPPQLSPHLPNNCFASPSVKEASAIATTQWPQPPLMSPRSSAQSSLQNAAATVLDLRPTTDNSSAPGLPPMGASSPTFVATAKHYCPSFLTTTDRRSTL